MRDTPSSPPTTPPGSPGSVGMPGSPTTSSPGSPNPAGLMSPRARRSPNFLSDSEDETTSFENEKSITIGHFSEATLQHLQKVLQQQAKLTSLVEIAHQKLLVAEALRKIPNINVGSIEQNDASRILTFITRGNEKKLAIKQEVGRGNNGVVHLATLEELDKNLVVKSITVYNKEIYKRSKKFVLDSELIKRIINEHKNMADADVDSDLIYDPASMTLYVTMPKYPGITAKKLISGENGLVAQLQSKIERGEDRAALVIFRNMLLVFSGALEAINDFHNKTARKGRALVHGDAWLDNFMVTKRADNTFEVNLIDYGACCESGITGEEYKDRKLQIGVGDFHTAPEIPSHGNRVLQELYAKINAKSDLHAVAASFIFEAMLEVFGTDRVKIREDVAINEHLNDVADGLNVVAKKFMLWAMTNACNSDWFFNMMSTPITEQAKDLRGVVTNTGSVEKRIAVEDAIHQVQEFIEHVDKLAQRSSADFERSARYADLDRATKKVNVAKKREEYKRVVRSKDADEHHGHPHH